MQTSSVESTTETTQAATKEQDRRITAKSVERTDIATDEEVITILKMYDTSKPVDEITGIPPLQSEIVQTRRSVQQQEHKQATEEFADIHTTEQEYLMQRDETVEATEITEKRGLNIFQKTLIYIGAISIILLLSWIGTKLFKHYLKPF